MDYGLIVAVWIASALVAAGIARARHHKAGPAFLLGLILGPLGVLVVLIQKPVEPVEWRR